MHLNLKSAARLQGLYLRGAVYWFRWTLNGTQYRTSTGETDEARAIEKARELRKSAPAPLDPLALPELVKHYLASKLAEGCSQKYIQFNLRQILEAFARTYSEHHCGLVTKKMVDEYLASQEVKPATRAAYRFQLKKFFDWCIQTRGLTANPVGEVKFGRTGRAGRAIRSTRKVWVRRTVISALIDNCKSLPLKYALYCGFHAGLRKEEVIQSRPEWFDFDVGEYGVLHVTRSENWQPKDRDERTIPLSAEFRRFLETEYLPSLNGAAYMIGGNKATGVRYRFDFRTAFENYITSQGIDITFHDTRRSFASNLVSSGVSLYKVAKWLGDNHSVVEATYGHLDPSDIDLARVFAR